MGGSSEHIAREAAIDRVPCVPLRVAQGFEACEAVRAMATGSPAGQSVSAPSQLHDAAIQIYQDLTTTEKLDFVARLYQIPARRQAVRMSPSPRPPSARIATA
jgi:hypothetical protein